MSTDGSPAALVSTGLSSAGLSSAEAGRRLLSAGPNELPAAGRRSALHQVWDVLKQPMLLLLLGAGTVNFALAEPVDGVLLMSFVLVVIGISIYQERKTENALAALRDLSAPRALVLRDGAQIRIASRDLVPGDVILLGEGDRIPADAALLEVANVNVDESAMTGESVPVRKRVATAAELEGPVSSPGGEETPWVFSGTLLVKGHALALVRRTGARTELGGIGRALNEIETGRTRLQNEVDRLVRTLAVLGLGAAALVLLVYGLTRHHWLEGVLAGIGTAMALLPEEFPVILTVFLALGAWRMSQRHVLTRRSPVIETLGSATVLCVDKTGTLTMNRMVVRELILDHRPWVVSDEPLPAAYREIVETSVLACPPDPFDPMDRAFLTLAAEQLAGPGANPGDLLREYPLSDALLAVVQVWRRPDGSGVVAAKGAPEAIAGLCGLDPSAAAGLTAQVEQATDRGLRVLAIARATHDVDAPLPDDQRSFAFELLGLAALHDPVRPGVTASVAECASAGVRVVMVTGDYPGTAAAIAREIGIDHGSGVLTGAEVADLSDAELAERVRSVNVFARMVPEQKLRLVRALRANNEVVGMTGDGVNDAPALRAADIGIAMGRRGTDVAREAAALVITDDDFSSIVGGIRQGRGIFDNLRKAMAYVIAVHVPIIGMAVVPVLVPGWPLVLLPVQIAFLQLIIDPVCSVVFEGEEIDPRVMDQPPHGSREPIFSRRVLAVSALQGLSVFLAVFGVYLGYVLSDRGDAVTRSAAFATLIFGNLALILVNRSWRLSVWQTLRQRRSPALRWIIPAALALLVGILSVTPVRNAFQLGAIGPWDWAVAAGAALAGVSWFEIYKAVRRR